MQRPKSGSGFGWALALISAASFATSGTFGTALTRAGWSPGAAVAVRVALGGLLLVVPAAYALRGQWGVLARNVGTLGLYGLIAVAGCQLFYFNALETLDVGVALLLEYTAIVMVVGWMWLRHRQRPRALTLTGTACALAGLVLVLDLLGGSVRIDLAGVGWALAAAVGLACYFVLSSRASNGLPPIVLACGGLLVGAVVLGVCGVIGVLPMAATRSTVDLAGSAVPWWLAVLGLAVLAAAVAYATGVGAIRRLGSRLGSFVGLTEVLFGVLIAWIVLGQMPETVQLAGGVLILGGVTLVRLDELRGERVLRVRGRGRVAGTQGAAPGMQGSALPDLQDPVLPDAHASVDPEVGARPATAASSS